MKTDIKGHSRKEDSPRAISPSCVLPARLIQARGHSHAFMCGPRTVHAAPVSLHLSRPEWSLWALVPPLPTSLGLFSCCCALFLLNHRFFLSTGLLTWVYNRLLYLKSSKIPLLTLTLPLVLARLYSALHSHTRWASSHCYLHLPSPHLLLNPP